MTGYKHIHRTKATEGYYYWTFDIWHKKTPVNGKMRTTQRFKTLREAIEARNQFMADNDLVEKHGLHVIEPTF